MKKAKKTLEQTKKQISKQEAKQTTQKKAPAKKQVIVSNNSCETASSDFAEIRSDAFAFCRYGVMLLVWIGFLFRIKSLILLTFVILVLSALLTVKYSPMIVLYENTIGLLVKGKTEKLGIGGMRFAHILGSVLSGIAVVFLYFINTRVGWIIALILAIMKTISACGLCPAYKLYNCMKSGGCCSFTKKLSKSK